MRESDRVHPASGANQIFQASVLGGCALRRNSDMSLGFEHHLVAFIKRK